MKVLSFFSKFTLICNVSFLIFVILGKIEPSQPVFSNPDTVLSISFFKDIIITLGFPAIFINMIMCLIYVSVAIVGKRYLLSRWITIVNFCFLIFEFYYFFF